MQYSEIQCVEHNPQKIVTAATVVLRVSKLTILLNENHHLSANKGTALYHWREIAYWSSWVKNPKRIGFLALQDGADKLSRNAGKELPLHVAYYPWRAQISRVSVFAVWQKMNI